MRLTEEQVRDRLADSYHALDIGGSLTPRELAVREWYESAFGRGEDFSVPRYHLVAMRAIGVRWVEDHYEEVGE